MGEKKVLFCELFNVAGSNFSGADRSFFGNPNLILFIGCRLVKIALV